MKKKNDIATLSYNINDTRMLKSGTHNKYRVYETMHEKNQHMIVVIYY